MTLRTALLLVLVLLGTGTLVQETGMAQAVAADAPATAAPAAMLHAGARSDDSIEVPLPDTVSGTRSPAAEPCSAVPSPRVPDATHASHARSACMAGAPVHCILDVVLPPSNGPPYRRIG